MSEDENQKAKKEPSDLSKLESGMRGIIKQWAEIAAEEERANQLKVSEIVRAANAASKQMEDMKRSFRLIAPQTQLMKDAAYIAQNLDKILADAKSKADFISRATIKLPTHFYAPYVKEASKDLSEIKEVIDVIPEVLEDESSKMKQAEKQELLSLYNEINDKYSKAMIEIDKLREQVEHLKQAKNAGKKKTRGANRTTRDKITRLAEYRQEAIDQRGIVPGWISSCHHVAVDSRSVLTYAPELGDKWEDKTYHWKGFDNDD